MKKKSLNTLMFVLCFATLLPTEVQAKEETSSYSKEDLKDSVKKLGTDFLDKIVEANDVINEKLSDIPMYKQDSLWLITDIPNVDPSEERNYFFVDTNPLTTIEKNTYYNQDGKKVAENDAKAVRKLEQFMYTYLTFSDVEKTFIMEYDYNLVEQTFTTNFVDFNEEYTWDEDVKVEYGRFVDVSLIIPEELQKPKYSDHDLKEILEILNDCEYEFFETPLKRERK